MARELPLARRLRDTAGNGLVVDRGALMVAYSVGASSATVEGIGCDFDGRLYEQVEVDREFEPEGSSDAELLARRYGHHGTEILTGLRGRFACVLWDDIRQQGVLSSDLLSTQPLFTWRGAGQLAFATELPDLLSMLPSTPPPDPVGFVGWLGGWTVPADRTLYEGISRLSPGQLVELNGDAPIRSYWRPRYAGTMRGSPEELAEGLRRELDRAISRRLSDRSSGIVLSGGLDSSIVTAIATCVKPPGSHLATYSAVFPGADYDEGWKVQSLGRELGIDPGLFELEPQGSLWLNLNHIKRWGLPLTGSGALIDMAMVVAASRDGVDVVLDGQTGDELFGCSPWLVADRLMRGRLLSARGLARRWPGRETTRREQRYILKNWGLRGAAPYSLHRFARSRRNPSEIAPFWLLPKLHSGYAEIEDRWAWKAAGSGPRWWRYLADRIVQGPHRELRLDYLRNRAAGAGVTSETPLYDVDLINYALRLPPQLAFNSAFNRPIARMSVQGLVPDDVRLSNKKAVFSPFCFDMLTNTDAPGIERLLTAPDAEIGAYADLKQIRRLLYDRPKPGVGFATTAWGSTVWRLAAAEGWLRSHANPDFADEALAYADVRPPSVRRLEDQPS